MHHHPNTGSANQGRVAYLGYQAAYPTYRIEVDYLDGSPVPSPQYTSTTCSTQNPGFVFGIANCSQITAVRIYDSPTGSNLLAEQSNFTNICTGGCWSQAQMCDDRAQPVGFWIAWDPTCNVIDITDSDVAPEGKPV